MVHEPDERALYRSLGDDAHRAHLPEPGELRRRSDRRTAVRAAVGTVAAVVAVAGIAVTANGLTRSAGPEPVGTPTVSPTVSETIHSSPPPEVISAQAWLGKDDLGFALGGRDTADVLAPCGRSPLVSDQFDGSPHSEATRLGNYHSPGTPAVNTPDGTIAQTIVVMGSEKDAAALWFLMQEAVKDCPEESELESGAVRYSLEEPPTATSGARADRAMLIKVSTSFEYLFGSPPDSGPAYIDSYVVVVQVGDAVTFLELRGWEASTTHLADVERLTRLATARLLDWRA
jgi:hypothetical protein